MGFVYSILEVFLVVFEVLFLVFIFYCLIFCKGVFFLGVKVFVVGIKFFYGVFSNFGFLFFLELLGSFCNGVCLVFLILLYFGWYIWV